VQTNLGAASRATPEQPTTIKKESTMTTDHTQKLVKQPGTVRVGFSEPAGVTDGELSDAQLADVAGGGNLSDWYDGITWWWTQTFYGGSEVGAMIDSWDGYYAFEVWDYTETSDGVPLYPLTGYETVVYTHDPDTGALQPLP
jgi:hypothetical protein